MYVIIPEPLISAAFIRSHTQKCIFGIVDVVHPLVPMQGSPVHPRYVLTHKVWVTLIITKSNCRLC